MSDEQDSLCKWCGQPAYTYGESHGPITCIENLQKRVAELEGLVRDAMDAYLLSRYPSDVCEDMHYWLPRARKALGMEATQ